MSDLKKYLEENRNIFDDKEPLDGHFERFEERLNRFDAEKNRKQTLKVRLIATYSAVASILLIIAAGIWLLRTPETETERNISEFTETEMFYQTQMDRQIAAILCKLDKADAETRNQLEKDLQTLEEDNSRFLEEIRNQNNEELAIYYLVEHYNANIETLQFINAKLGEYFNC
ncbi:MAG: hypothetical protein LBF59_04370 [Prevotellaceae bacterium]|jgi:hypothetical protein|nr:hypothetical protein [Prevotellaceae bacterium]